MPRLDVFTSLPATRDSDRRTIHRLKGLVEIDADTESLLLHFDRPGPEVRSRRMKSAHSCRRHPSCHLCTLESH